MDLFARPLTNELAAHGETSTIGELVREVLNRLGLDDAARPMAMPRAWQGVLMTVPSEYQTSC